MANTRKLKGLTALLEQTANPALGADLQNELDSGLFTQEQLSDYYTPYLNKITNIRQDINRNSLPSAPAIPYNETELALHKLFDQPASLRDLFITDTKKIASLPNKKNLLAKLLERL